MPRVVGMPYLSLLMETRRRFLPLCRSMVELFQEVPRYEFTAKIPSLKKLQKSRKRFDSTGRRRWKHYLSRVLGGCLLAKVSLWLVGSQVKPFAVSYVKVICFLSTRHSTENRELWGFLLQLAKSRALCWREQRRKRKAATPEDDGKAYKKTTPINPSWDRDWSVVAYFRIKSIFLSLSNTNTCCSLQLHPQINKSFLNLLYICLILYICVSNKVRGGNW